MSNKNKIQIELGSRINGVSIYVLCFFVGMLIGSIAQYKEIENNIYHGRTTVIKYESAETGEVFYKLQSVN